MKKNKYSSVHYNDYLQLEKIIDAQSLRSTELGTPAHDEMLFIITHQAYELWFKQIIHELDSVAEMFQIEIVEEKNIGIAVSRLNRVVEIFKVLIDQIRILETMTPLDFLDFRNYLLPASGFQSFQFRKLEVMLGLKNKDRITYNNKPYHKEFSADQQKELKHLEDNKSIQQLIEQWLERIPFLETGEFNFLEKYKTAVENMHEKEQASIQETTFLCQGEKDMRIKMLEDNNGYFLSVLSEEKHNELVKEGALKMSYKSTMAALLINLYRDEPILRGPYQLLATLLDIDGLLTMWRYNHAQMVMRMLGKKMGTGGSSGHDYLKSTADNHGIFSDFNNISTLLIPRSELPELPEQLKKELGFYFTVNK